MSECSTEHKSDKNKTYRNYDNNNVITQYKLMRMNQTYYYATNIKKYNLERLHNNGIKMNVMDYIEKLNDFVDESDPDINISNVHHLYQTAEKIRSDGHPDWLQLVGFIHDLGKIMGFIFNNDDTGTSINSQWGIVGDTYILGCRLRNNKVYQDFDVLCPDMKESLYNTDMGIYTKGCGLSSCIMTWGHDEYLYDVLQFNRTINNVNPSFPKIADYIIRFHSLYPWHSFGEYIEFESEFDKENKNWVQLFNKYDLYTKENKIIDFNNNDINLKIYYQQLIKKYFPNEYLIF